MFRRRPLILAMLATMALVETGCRSLNPCSSCGPSPVGWFQRVRARVFRPGGCGACGGAVIGAEPAPIIEGPPAVVTPVPAPVPGPAAALPAPAETQPQIEPIPQATPGPAPEAAPSSGSRSPNGKAAYEAARPSTLSGRSRRNGMKRTDVPSLEPTPRSAQGSAPEAAFLDNLPPVDVPVDTPSNEITPPSPPSAPAEAAKGAADTNGAAKQPEGTSTAPAAVPAPVSVAPGLRRFSVVEPNLAGGSLPSAVGLDWLAEKGYRTLLDLREPHDVQPNFIADVASRGFRYVALPITLKTIDKNHIESFEFELSVTQARPLYFFDAQGDRAGTLWYIHRVTVDKVDPQTARRESAELGLLDESFQRAAMTYVDSLNPPKPPKLPEEPEVPGPDRQEAPPQPVGPPKPEASSEAAPSPLVEEKPVASATVPAVPAHDPTVWRPFAAMVFTGLGVPLAYWSASALPAVRNRLRASLPGPRRGAKSLPGASDA